jgi:hypothetical protein
MRDETVARLAFQVAWAMEVVVELITVLAVADSV